MALEIVKLGKALSDEVRVRILTILGREPLSVSEICSVLELKQSRVSRHLGILNSAGLLDRLRSGAHIYYGLHHAMRQSRELTRLLELLQILPGTDSQSIALPVASAADRQRLHDLLSDRARFSIDFFQNQAQADVQAQQYYVDRDYYASSLEALLPEKPGVLVDLGCGMGALASRLQPYVDRLILVDQSQRMLDLALSNLPEPDADMRLGALQHLPLGDGEVQTVVASMVLHHLPEPLIALKEIRRVLARDGYLLVAELAEHSEETMRRRFADFWLGFKSRQLEAWFKEAGFNIEETSSGKGAGQLDCVVYRLQRDDSSMRVYEAGRQGKQAGLVQA